MTSHFRLLDVCAVPKPIFGSDVLCSPSMSFPFPNITIVASDPRITPNFCPRRAGSCSGTTAISGFASNPPGRRETRWEHGSRTREAYSGEESNGN